MKKSLACLAAATLIAGCTIFKTVPRYAPDPENAETVQAHVEIPVNIGEFTDAGFRKELTCRSLAIIEAPDDWTYADAIRHALIDELARAGRYSAGSPVTITAHLNRIDVETEKGSWIIRMTLASTNGKKMTIEEKHEYGSISLGELSCTQAAYHYMSALKKFMKRLLSSPEFSVLARDTPPSPSENSGPDASRIPETEEEMEAAEAKARAAGRERIRQADSLESRKTLMEKL